MELISHTVFLLLSGFVLGLEHALEADHVAAVATMASETKSVKKASIFGVAWGVGHTCTLVVLSILVLFFHIIIPEGFAVSFEAVVGVVLILLGAHVLFTLKKENVHMHTHEHGEEGEHIHIHSHKLRNDHSHLHRPFGMGIVHGLAGSGALIVIALAAADTFLEGMMYVSAFGIGSILSMMLVGAVIGRVSIFAARFERFYIWMRTIAGGVSVSIGIVILYTVASHTGWIG